MKPLYREKMDFDGDELGFKCFINSTSNSKYKTIDVQPHWHDVIEILFVEYGNAKQHINGNLFDIKKGDIVIIKEQDIHGTWSNTETDILVIQFFGDYFKNTNLAITRVYDKFCENVDLSFPINDMSFVGKNIKTEIDYLVDANKRKDQGWEFAVISSLFRIVSECIRVYTNRDNENRYTSAVKDNLKKVFEFTSINYFKDIKLSQAASLLNYSVPHFCRIFKDSMGMGYHEYLTRFRITVAVGMLKEKVSVTETAMACGFASINSFIRAFNKIVGISPGQFKSKF